MRERVDLCFTALLAVSIWGCATTCDKEDLEKEIRYSGGTVDASGTTYETNPWTGPYLHFPAGRRYVIEHRLGAVPPAPDLFVAFEEHPLKRKDGNNVAPPAGNQVVIEWVDEEIIQVRNDTCSEFYLRVVATIGAAPTADAGVD
jgi:hypothetical protein